MWLEIICGLVIYSLYKLFISDGDDVLDMETSDSTALFAIADRLSKLYDGAKVFIGLRIDLELLNKGELVVIAVKNLSGFIYVKPDGSWVSESITILPQFEPLQINVVCGAKQQEEEETAFEGIFRIRFVRDCTKHG